MWKWLPCVCCVTMHLILGAGFSIFSPVWPLSAPLTPLRKLQLVAFLQGESWQPWTDSSTLNYPQAPWKASVEWLRHVHCVIPSAFLHSSAADWTIKACPLWPFSSCYVTKPFLGEIPLWKRIIISINIAQSWYIFNEIITLSWHLPCGHSNATSSNPQNYSCSIFRQTSGASDWSQLSFSASGWQSPSCLTPRVLLWKHGIGELGVSRKSRVSPVVSRPQMPSKRRAYTYETRRSIWKFIFI